MLYRALRPFVLGLLTLAFRVRVIGREHVPKDGVYVIAPSHRSILDIPFAAYITRRRIRFMGKKEIFSTWIGRRLFDMLGAIPVDRGGTDRTALRMAQGALEAGEPVAVFPEGTRNTGPILGEMHDGAAYLALRLGLPIVPVGIGGSEAILATGKVIPRFKRVAVVVGPAIQPPVGEGTRRRSDITKHTEEIRTQLQACFHAALELVGESGAGEVSERR